MKHCTSSGHINVQKTVSIFTANVNVTISISKIHVLEVDHVFVVNEE